MNITSKFWRAWLPGLILVIGLVAGIVNGIRFGGSDQGGSYGYPWAALAVASGGLLVLGLLLELIGRTIPNRQQYGWLAIVIGFDGRLSTSKSQALMWTLGIATALLYLAGIVVFGASHDDALVSSATTDWNQYFILLGGPFAAAVLSKLAVTSKVNSGDMQKTPTAAASAQLVGSAADAPAASVATTGPKLADIVSNDNGETDLVDTQYLIFNVVAFVYVVGVFVSHIVDPNYLTQIAGANPTLSATQDLGLKYALPNLPAVLLSLTSLSALTYVGNKTVQTTGPRVGSVTPSNPAGGTTVTVVGTNLVPSSLDAIAARAQTSVLITDTSVTSAASPGTTDPNAAPPASTGVTVAPSAATPTSVTFTMPPGFAGKPLGISIITAGSVATAAYPATGT